MPDDPYRGLYLTPDTVDRILDRRAGRRRDGAHPTRCSRSWPTNFGLTEPDVRFLLIALAPEIDPRFERLYAYLNDDVTQRRATVGLAL